jgi:hypothetical protein
MYCPFCGHNVSEGIIKCNSCGKDVSSFTVVKPLDKSVVENINAQKEADKELTPEEEAVLSGDAGIGDGWYIFTNSCKFIVKKPIFILPIFFSWVIFASGVIYLRFYTNVNSFWLGVLIIFVVILVISIVICNANLLMLEFIQQMESGKKISFTKALKEVISIDSLKVFPIALVWAILWCVIIIIRAISRPKKQEKDEGKEHKPNLKEIAYSLQDISSDPFSWFDLGLNLAEKLIRMAVFLALPAIAWENQGPRSAISKAIEVIKKHSRQFLINYSITLAATTIMAIPLAIIFTLSKDGVEFSSGFWTGVIIYEGIVWTLGIYLEQMSSAILYLWHIKWVKHGAAGKLTSVLKPDLFDSIYELK